MKSKTKLYIGVAVIIFGLANIGYTIYGAVVADTTDASKEVASSTLAAAAVNSLQNDSGQTADFPTMGTPQKFAIPSLGIDTTVIEVGVTAKGNMAVPKSFQEVGWYKYGPQPGNNGSAVMAGHVDNGLGLAGVFKKLQSIGIGDRVTVTDDAGQQAVFQVTATSSLDYKSTDTGNIFLTTGEPTLTIITCEGAWVQSDRTYDHRLVVTAKRVS
jgi:LPXTG-site transpeptidase (sortase) family protein